MADVYRAVTLGGSAFGEGGPGPSGSRCKADMIAVDLEDFHMGAVDDPIRTIFMCGCGRDVKLSIINGKTVMKNRTIEGVDLEEIRQRGRSIMTR